MSEGATEPTTPRQQRRLERQDPAAVAHHVEQSTRRTRQLDGLPPQRPRQRSRSPYADDEAQALFLLTDSNHGPSLAYLTGKLREKEVTLNGLNLTERNLYDLSMAKEWENWMRYQAVEPLDQETLEGYLAKGAKTVGMRWAHTDKNAKLRVPGTPSARLPVLAKSRLVVQGHQERGLDLRTDSPTASLLSFNMLCAISAIKKFRVCSADAPSAYLQGKDVERTLLLRCPHPPPPGIKKGTVFRARASIYGTRDAGRRWWERLREVLVEAGWIESNLEKCFFRFYNKNGKLAGLLISHVDDLLIGFDEYTLKSRAASKLSKRR